jgi:hypothetical protein
MKKAVHPSGDRSPFALPVCERKYSITQFGGDVKRSDKKHCCRFCTESAAGAYAQCCSQTEAWLFSTANSKYLYHICFVLSTSADPT